jgi:hypothetical protein
MQVLRAGCFILHLLPKSGLFVRSLEPILSLLVCEVRDKIRVRLQAEGVEQNLFMRVRRACLNGARMRSASRSPRVSRGPCEGSAKRAWKSVL